MLVLKLIRSLIKTLNSNGTPGQVAAGVALGAVFGLTPLLSLHNLVILALAMLLNVSFGGVMLGWAAGVPVGFALDPLFNVIGTRLLVHTPALTPLWTAWYNTPVLALTRFNNTIVLGSFLVWLVSCVPVFFVMRWAVEKYRERIYERLKKAQVFRTLQASKLYNVYRLFRP